MTKRVDIDELFNAALQMKVPMKKIRTLREKYLPKVRREKEGLDKADWLKVTEKEKKSKVRISRLGSDNPSYAEHSYLVLLWAKKKKSNKRMFFLPLHHQTEEDTLGNMSLFKLFMVAQF